MTEYFAVYTETSDIRRPVGLYRNSGELTEAFTRDGHWHAVSPDGSRKLVPIALSDAEGLEIYFSELIETRDPDAEVCCETQS